MATLVDCRFESLRSQGFTGTTSDMLLQWLLANGATTPTIPDAWDEVLTILVGAGQYNDRWHEWLLTNGYGFDGEQIHDMEMFFWCNGGLLVPLVPVESFDNSFDASFG